MTRFIVESGEYNKSVLEPTVWPAVGAKVWPTAWSVLLTPLAIQAGLRRYRRELRSQSAVL